MTSSPPFWWTKTKDLSLASFVRPPEVVHFSIVISVSRGWLKTSYCVCYPSNIFRETGTYKLDETFTKSLPSKTFTSYEVDFFVFSGTALSTSRFISSSVTKGNPINSTCKNNGTLGNIGNIRSRAFRPIACERKYLLKILNMMNDTKSET